MRPSYQGAAHHRHPVFIVTDMRTNQPLMHVHCSGSSEHEQFSIIEELLRLELPVSITQIYCYCQLGGPRLAPPPADARVVHTPPRRLEPS